MKEIYCNECSGMIKHRGELVTAIVMFQVVPFHDDCYSNVLKGCQTMLVGNKPINGTSGTITATLTGMMLFIFPYLTEMPVYLGVFFLIPLIYRLYSWFSFERFLPA